MPPDMRTEVGECFSQECFILWCIIGASSSTVSDVVLIFKTVFVIKLRSFRCFTPPMSKNKSRAILTLQDDDIIWENLVSFLQRSLIPFQENFSSFAFDLWSPPMTRSWFPDPSEECWWGDPWMGKFSTEYFIARSPCRGLRMLKYVYLVPRASPPVITSSLSRRLIVLPVPPNCGKRASCRLHLLSPLNTSTLPVLESRRTAAGWQTKVLGWKSRYRPSTQVITGTRWLSYPVSQSRRHWRAETSK